MKLALTLGAALLASSAAVAMEGIDLDIDGDGFATKAEITQLLGVVSRSDFNQLDGNNDGRLSGKELASPGVREVIGRYESSMSIVHGVSDVDLNGDRFLTRDELKAQYDGFNEQDFRDLDLNNDQRIDAREFYNPASQAIVTRYEMAPTMDLTIQQVDMDGDYFVSYEELKDAFPSVSQADFNQIDLNNDNRVHSVEFYNSQAQIILDRTKG